MSPWRSFLQGAPSRFRGAVAPRPAFTGSFTLGASRSTIPSPLRASTRSITYTRPSRVRTTDDCAQHVRPGPHDAPLAQPTRICGTRRTVIKLNTHQRQRTRDPQHQAPRQLAEPTRCLGPHGAPQQHREVARAKPVRRRRWPLVVVARTCGTDASVQGEPSAARYHNRPLMGDRLHLGLYGAPPSHQHLQPVHRTTTAHGTRPLRMSAQTSGPHRFTLRQEQTTCLSYV